MRWFRVQCLERSRGERASKNEMRTFHSSAVACARLRAGTVSFLLGDVPTRTSGKNHQRVPARFTPRAAPLTTRALETLNPEPAHHPRTSSPSPFARKRGMSPLLPQLQLVRL